MVALWKHGVRWLLVCTVLVASFANFYELWVIDCSFISASSFAHFSCCSPVVIFSCCSLTASASGPVPQLHPLQLLLPSCICFICCFPIASASAAAPQLLVLAAALRMHPLQLLFPDCIHFSCCSLMVPNSAAAPWLCQLLFPNCMCLLQLLLPIVSTSDHAHAVWSSLVPPPEHPTSITHICTDTNKSYYKWWWFGKRTIMIVWMNAYGLSWACTCNVFKIQ